MDKCAMCPNIRSRNDLCNRCRQRIETRAKTLNQQKLINDCQIVSNVVSFINKHVDSTKIGLSSAEFGNLFVKIYPYLV